MKMFFISFASLCLLATAFAGPSRGQSTIDGPDNNGQAVVTVRAEFFVDQKSRTGELAVTVTVRDGYHIYAMTQPKPFLATKIEVAPSDQVELSGPFTPARRAIILRHDSIDVELHEYEGEITWTAPLKLTPSADARAMKITGKVTAQACYDQGCLMPQSYAFTAELKSQPSRSVVAPTRANADVVAQGGHESPASGVGATVLDFDKIEAEGGSAASLPLALVLPMAFAAGLILNFMPCVLPVIGLKIMAFAQQAGDSRGRVFALNLWYSLGLVSVFLVLATLAVFLGLGWGQQFSSVTFNVVLASVVFAFAMSFLGVWEIPIPGFVGSGAANQLAQREGAVGAFSKGALTTVLATPCSGPLLGSALPWAVVQPPLFTYLVFTFVGLGMASPYLLIGAFPRLISRLPKPGEWMNTFKQAMGFVLLATVAYLLSFMPAPFVVPTVAFLIGVGAACWWIGRLSLTVSLDAKLSYWIQSAMIAGAAGFVSFGWLQDVMQERFDRAIAREWSARNVVAAAHSGGEKTNDEIRWEPYSHGLLAKYTAAGKTVFVDFTADWCLTCKANEAVAIDKPETRQLIADNGIIPLKADKTQPAPEVDELLRTLGNKAGSIPFYAVFPAGNPNKPILLDGMFTSAEPILAALRQAVPQISISSKQNKRLGR